MRTYSRLDLHRYTLRQQCLSDPAGSVEQAVTHMLGCRGAEGSTPYLSLLWRVDGFQPAQFDKAVHEDRSLLRVRGPRGTYYWVTPALAPWFLAAAQTEPQPEFLRKWGVADAEYRALTDEVNAAISGRPLTVGELKQSIPQALQRPVQRKGYPASTTLAVALEAMHLDGQVTFLKEPGFARHRSDEYYGDARDVTRPNLVGSVAALYPSVLATRCDKAEARRCLVRAYIKAYGPVTFDDIVWWTGWTKREVRDHLQSCANEIAEICVQGLSGTFLIHAPTFEPGATTGGAPAAYLLPGGDSLMKGYSGFGRFLTHESHDQNVLRFMPAVLADGLGLGNWGYRMTGNTADLVVELFDQPDESVVEQLRAAAARISQLITGDPHRLQMRIQVRSSGWNPRAAYPPPQ